MSTAYQIVVCGSIVPDPLQTLEPVTAPTGPALKNEMMLPAVLDPWAGHALYEAAHLDGAASGRRFFHITLPLLGPAHLFLFVTGFISTFQLFGPIYVMTQGGPLKGTWSLVYEIWWKAFREFRMGYAAALAWILFAIIFVVTLVQWRYAGKKVYYS